MSIIHTSIKMTDTKLSSNPHKVRTTMNYTPKKGKKFKQLSMTVPDDSIPLRVLLERYTKGLPVSIAQRTPVYEGEESMLNGTNPATLDLADIEQMKLQNKDYIESLNQQIAHEKFEKHQAKLAKESKHSSLPDNSGTDDKTKSDLKKDEQH